MDSDIILVIVVATALAFDFTNGFHDTANVVATSISTRALSPRAAVGLAAVLNFVGRVHLAEGRGDGRQGHRRPDADHARQIVFAGLVGAIAWNLVTWYFGLPSSSSHALIGGVVGRGASSAKGASAIIGGDGAPRQGAGPGAWSPRCSPSLVGGDRDPALLPDRRAAAARAR